MLIAGGVAVVVAIAFIWRMRGKPGAKLQGAVLSVVLVLGVLFREFVKEDRLDWNFVGLMLIPAAGVAVLGAKYGYTGSSEMQRMEREAEADQLDHLTRPVDFLAGETPPPARPTKLKDAFKGLFGSD